MLTDPTPSRRRRRRQQSLRQWYEQFLLQRIEEFKNQLSREKLMAIADEAVQELEKGSDDQLVLTEVLVLEQVDRLIMRRLNLPTFRRWRERHLRLRRAQRAPTHWGLSAGTPLTAAAPTADEGAVALVVGRQATSAALYLAAHDWPVVFIDQELSTVESAETRAAAESLATQFRALVVGLGDWFPDVTPRMAVLDRETLDGLDALACRRFLETLGSRTMTGGMHCMLPTHGELQGRGLGDEVFERVYAGWRIEPPSKVRSGGWFVAIKP